jgi:8-oxo-dGTP pyrophosphatase MutT (NUDIX family)
MRAVDADAFVPSVLPTAGNSPAQGPAIRDAATVILVSDRPDLHVLMMERTRRAVFSPGATVFPGGAVDAADAESRSHARVDGLDDDAASAEQNLPVGGLAFRIAAIRECFEEAGILLATDAATGSPVEHDRELVAERERLNAGELSFVDLLESRDLALAARDLRLFSHWLTPVGAPRRYNTWFFVAPAPDGEDGAHDDNELVASEWVRPLDALAKFADGGIDLILPTEMSLRALGHYECTADLLSDLDAVHRDARGGLQVVPVGAGERVALPGDAGRPTGSWTVPLPEISHRAERALAGGVSE